MEFKGITWVYQKFEAMCLEVEEAILEDTTKYVESQVQKVGTTVKKFYSDVMEDLLPPSHESMNVASGDTDTDIKPKPKKEPLLIGYYDVHSLVPQSTGVSNQNKCSEPSGAIGKKVGVHRRSIGIKRISKDDRPSKGSSGMASLSGDKRSKLASSNTSSSTVASDNINVMSSSSDLHKAEVKGNASIPDTPVEPHAESVRRNKENSESVSPNKDDAESVMPNKDDSEPVRPNKDDTESMRPNKDDSESVRPNKDDSESVRPNKDASNHISLASDDNSSVESVRLKGDQELPTGTSLSDVSFSVPGSGTRSNACSLECTSMEVGSSNVRTTFYAAESLDKKVITPNEDILDMAWIEKHEVGDGKRVKIEMEKLEESCVMVEERELHSAPQETMKHKSYKKRIQEALWLKSRSRKDSKNEREVVIPVKVGNADSYESEWELL